MTVLFVDTVSSTCDDERRVGVMREAVVAVIRRSGRVLVIKRGPLALLPGYWSPLSGRIEPGESQEETVVREVSEEVGLQVEAVAKVWECETDDGNYLLHWWTVREVGGRLTLDPGEASDARWVNYAEFRELEPTFEADHVFFRRVLPQLS